MKTPIEYLANIITQTLQIGIDNIGNPIYIDPSRVVIENQQNFIVPSKGLMVLISFLGQDLISQTTELETKNTFKEIIAQNFKSNFGIELFSKDFSAMEQKDNLMLYLNSYTSRNLQNKYNISIPIRDIKYYNLSNLEGADRIYRFKFDISIFHGKSLVSTVPHYDNNFIPQTNIL